MDKQLTREQKAVIQQCQNANFVPDVAFTLTLDLDKGRNKNSTNRTSHKTKAEKTAEKWLNLNPHAQRALYDELESMFKELYEKLAKLSYGRNCKRLALKNPNKKFRMFGGIERSENGMLHMHGATILPEHIEFEKLQSWMLAVWAENYIGSKQQYKFKPVYDADGWIAYISKDFHKNNSMGYISESKLS